MVQGQQSTLETLQKQGQEVNSAEETRSQGVVGRWFSVRDYLDRMYLSLCSGAHEGPGNGLSLHLHLHVTSASFICV